MAMDVYMYFDGNAREAVEFYAKVFKVEKNEITTYGDMPSDPDFNIPESQKKLILNTDLIINGTKVMFSDVFSEMTSTPLIKGNSITLVISNDDKNYIKNLFDKLKEGGKVEMKLGETFWSKMFGSVCDKFGNTWELNYSGE